MYFERFLDVLFCKSQKVTQTPEWIADMSPAKQRIYLQPITSKLSDQKRQEDHKLNRYEATPNQQRSKSTIQTSLKPSDLLYEKRTEIKLPDENLQEAEKTIKRILRDNR
jgi:hypothetical protein